MALINCPECYHGDISDKATVCPYCGYNIIENSRKKHIIKRMGKTLTSFLSKLFFVVLIPLTTIIYNNASKDSLLVEDINNILIGESAEYIKECFGEPIFKSYNEEFGVEEKVYNNKYSILRMFFKNDKLIGYFVTAKEDGGQIKLQEQFEYFCQNKPLGGFSYRDIECTPDSIESYTSQGQGHLYYCERYYYGSPGSYYNFCFLYLDYGFAKNNYSLTGFEEDDELDETEISEDTWYGGLALDRSKSYPNTYGIVDDCNGIEEMISSYNEFDLQAFRQGKDEDIIVRGWIDTE